MGPGRSRFRPNPHGVSYFNGMGPGDFFGFILGPCWQHFEVIVRPFGGQCGDHVGVIWESFWSNVGVIFG